jgi:hypothetical protein
MIPGQEPYTPEEERRLAEFVHEAALADPGETDEPGGIGTVDVDGHRYSRVDVVQFVRDMRIAGLEVMHYCGRFGWEGPAVTVDDLQISFYATKVKLQWDGMGLGWVVYPKVSDPGTAL